MDVNISPVGNVTAPPEDRGDPLIFFRPRFVQAIGVMAFAYVCHHNSFLIYESLTDASEKRYIIDSCFFPFFLFSDSFLPISFSSN